MTELRLRGQQVHWESNRSPHESLVNTVEPCSVAVKRLSTYGVEPLTLRQEQQLQQHKHLEDERMQHDKHQLQQQQVQRQIHHKQQQQMQKEQMQQQQMRQEQQQNQLQVQYEQQQQQQQQTKQQRQQQQIQEQQHMQNEQMQQRIQQLMQQDQHAQQQSQRQQQQQHHHQDALTTSHQSSPSHSTCSSTLHSSSTPSAASSSTVSFALSICSSSSLPSDSSESDRYKTELCRSYEENGTCRYGNKCLFAHGRREMRLLDRHPKYKTEFCRTYHSSGFCPYGQRCHFIHSCQNSPILAGPSPGLAIRIAGEGSLAGSIGQQLSTVMVHATGRERNEALGKFVEPEQRFNGEARQFNEPERRLNDLERKLFEMELERSTTEYDGRHLEPERKSLETNWKIIQAERRCIETERKPLELELSAILQRRRRQMRCGSVGSSCEETPPPFIMVGLDNFNPSQASSPMIVDETRSPSFTTSSSSPLTTTHSNPVDIPRSGAACYGPVSRILKGSPGLPTSHLGLSSFTPPKDIGSVQTPPWTLGDALASRSTSRTSSPSLHQFVTMSSAARQQGTFFLFDGDTLAKLIQRS